jgi:putative transposase
MGAAVNGGGGVNGQVSTGRNRADERREWRCVQGDYRKLLFGAGNETVSAKGGFTQAEVEKIVREGGQLTTVQLLRCRVRHFTDGLVLGSKVFVNGYFEAAKAGFGARRKSGARKLGSCAEAGLFTIRDLRRGAISGT